MRDELCETACVNRDPLFGTMPVQPPPRTVALFAAPGPAVVVALVAPAVLMLAVGSSDGFEAPTVQASEIVLEPGAAALLQGPVFVAFGDPDARTTFCDVEAHGLETAINTSLVAGYAAF